MEIILPHKHRPRLNCTWPHQQDGHAAPWKSSREITECDFALLYKAHSPPNVCTCPVDCYTGPVCLHTAEYNFNDLIILK